jgi:hypothetical protein
MYRIGVADRIGTVYESIRQMPLWARCTGYVLAPPLAVSAEPAQAEQTRPDIVFLCTEEFSSSDLRWMAQLRRERCPFAVIGRASSCDRVR